MADTIELMRKRVLDMAIRGKLVEQHPEEVIPNVSLLKNKTQDREFISFSQQYKIPENWVWTTLENITNSETLRNGDWILSENMTEKEEVKLIQLGSVGFGKFLEKNYKHISYETFNKLNCTEITTNDLLINRLIGDKMLVTLLPEINGKKITSVDVCIMKPNQEVYDSRYMMYAMMSPLFQMQVMAKSSGTTRKRISKNNLVKLLISFPPLEEQKRIVAKIEEIFAIINQIGTKKEEALSIIRNIRQTALQDAIRGVLVEQEENDEPASVLYEKIQAEKEQLVIEKKIKKEKPLLEIDKNEIPFEIPKNWRWTRLGDLGFFKKGPFGSALTKSIFVEDSLESIKVYEQKNAIQSDCTLGEYFITKDYYEEKMASNTVMPGDIIVSCAGTIGKSYIIPDGARLGIINQALMRIRVYTINKQYFRLIFNHVIHTDGAQGKGSAIKNIPPMKVLNNLLVPLPPLAEQERIVEKIDEIMAICDQMEAIFDGSSEVKENFKVV